MMSPKTMAVVGGGWAGLAAAVELVRRGHKVVLHEMAPQLGGRARQVSSKGMVLDNGQHIMLGAYSRTIALMKLVGVDLDGAFLRMPLRLVYPDKNGFALPHGAPASAFIKAVCKYEGWSIRNKGALLWTCAKWAARSFKCDPSLTVGQLTKDLPPLVRSELIDPLCVAALNTPAATASAAIFLNVLRDALFNGDGAADLLLPRQPLSRLWPEPAAEWLRQAGATIRLTSRVEKLQRTEWGWNVDGEAMDGVILACTPPEAARLVADHAPEWAEVARGLRYEPIVTVYAHSSNTKLPVPMMALHSDNIACPAQFVFDLGITSKMEGVLAFVISGATSSLDRGTDSIFSTTLEQGESALKHYLQSPLVGLRCIVEKRATFLCTPDLVRPATEIRRGLCAAGDYIDGRYPATIEGAMRSGIAAADRIGVHAII